jgi:hypothetical protein
MYQPKTRDLVPRGCKLLLLVKVPLVLQSEMQRFWMI